jgi:hypothetical protein
VGPLFVDTHVVSYAKRGLLAGSIRGASISSVSASELLLVYGEKRTAANYYVPLVSKLHWGSIAASRRDHPFSKLLTDQIVFDFGSDYEPLVEFGSLAIAEMINERRVELLQRSIQFLSKGRQKIIREDFRVLVENEVRCVPLNTRAVDIGHRLLDAFRSSDQRIKTTFRNTWNDLLILSAAWANNEELLSNDDQLNRFAASSFGEFSQWGSGILKIRFPALQAPTARRISGESKRYVNRGWQASFRTRIKQAL